MKTKLENYGIEPDNPLMLSGISESLYLLDSLVTSQGLHIIYHRKGSFSGQGKLGILDHYEVLNSDGQYGDIYISIYSRKNQWIPPVGYMFDPIGDLILQGICEFQSEEMPKPENIDPKYIYKGKLSGGSAPDSEGNPETSLLEMLIDKSTGINLHDPQFPYGVIKRNLQPGRKAMNQIMKIIQPRVQKSRSFYK